MYVLFQRPSWTESVDTVFEYKSVQSEIEEAEAFSSSKKTGCLSTIPSKFKKVDAEKAAGDAPLDNASDSEMKKKIMEGIKLYKLYEQRDKDLNNSNIGLDSWQFTSENKDDYNIQDIEDIFDDLDDEDANIDEELLELINQQNLNEMDKNDYLRFGVIICVVQFLFS